MPTPIQLLAVSGSLRARSTNGALVHAFRRLAPADLEVVVYDGLDTLPHFNPDLDNEGAVAPATVAALRAAVARADALLVSSPEYAHGVPGALKNALDWLVSSVDFPGKPVALVGASARATYARASLEETLRTMSAHLIDELPAAVAIPRRTMTAGEIAADPALAAEIRGVLEIIAGTVRPGR